MMQTNDFNHKFIAHSVGVLLVFESILLLICCGVSLFYGEGDLSAFGASFGICFLVGISLLLYGNKSLVNTYRTESYIVVALSWVFFTLFGMLPFLLGGYIPSVTDAFFETMSGFTTTGATILDHIESLPHGILFWRSLTQWVGGLGIVLFTIVLLPGFGSGSQMLFLSEATGVTHDKLHPKTRVMARYLLIVYVSLTVVETLLLRLGGMDWFDAVCHSFATTATGGFSTKQDSVGFWHSAYIEYVIALFMLLSAINFSLYVVALKGQARQWLRNAELRWFLTSVGLLTFVITLTLIFGRGYGVEEGFRKALFQVVTCHTSCGFATDDYNLWPSFTWMLLLFAMLSGGCTSSTSGGIKNLRLVIVTDSIKNHFRQILHPRAILPVKTEKVFEGRVVFSVFVFVVAYLGIAFIGWTLLMCCGVGLTEALSTVISSMGNVGPGLGNFGPAFSWASLPDVAKWILSALMLIGRLEIFGFLLVFYPPMWKSHWA